jgi:8-oxo-dGTP diphosphatase
MIKRYYSLVGRLAHRLAKPFLQVYFSKSKIRVRAMVINENQEVLLVRSWFGHQRWSLPGGGIGSGESLEAAAAREVLEETGVVVPEADLNLLGRFANDDSYPSFTVACLTARTKHQSVKLRPARRLEILDAAWFKLDSLPIERSQVVDRALELTKSKQG